MSWVIQPFQNTDLHNIYEAIVAGGGGGGDALAGLILNGSQLPDGSDVVGTNPFWLKQTWNNSAIIAQLLDGLAFPQGVTTAGTYPYYAEQNYFNILSIQNYANAIDSSTSKLFNFLNGYQEPDNLSGFYPLHVITDTDHLNDINGNTANTANSCANIDLNTSGLFKFFDGSASPSDYTGFYPDTLYKIKENTSNTNNAIEKSTKIGTTSGTTLSQGAGVGYASATAAAVAAVSFMNTLLGTYTIVNLTFMDGGGANNHSWVCVYRAG